MTKVLLIGCNGKMGGVVTECAENYGDIEIAAGVDVSCEPQYGYPVFSDINDVDVESDVIIDFSNPVVTDSVLEYAESHSIPVVMCTTGLSERQLEKINETAKKVPVFSSFNMSLGVNLLLELSKKAAKALGNSFDIEIIEQHHNQKIDAPSGTAFMLANAVNEALGGEMQYKYDRHSSRIKREKNEIGIHSVRGGTIVGEHSVIFAGNDEIITLSHSARSKSIFAVGALNAARFLNGKAAGLYNMQNLID